MSAEPFYNLIDEDWIPVLDVAGNAREVSLRRVFHEASDLVTLAGELPTQSVALLRLLLAVLHRSVEGPESFLAWAAIRENWDGTLAAVDEYLDELHDRFWLQHPVHPFMQVPDLHTAKDEVFGLSRIVCDGPGTSSFMTTRLGDNLETATWAEAARWLVHAQAYDVSGIHSGAVGDPRVKGGRGYGVGTGWAGQIGSVHIVGDNLRETLLLNLFAPDAAGMEIDVDSDVPVWERAPLTVLPEGWHPDDGPEQGYRQPSGPVDLYTWPARRIRLVGTPERVTGVVNAQGDRAQGGRKPPVSWFPYEPMTSWRLSKTASGSARGMPIYSPVRHLRERAFWRGLEALLPQASKPVEANAPARRRPPALVDWAARLQHEGQLDGRLVRLRAVGIEYGSNESVFGELVADELALPAVLFTDHDLAQQAVNGVAAAERAVRALGDLAQDVALAAGGSSESDAPRSRISARAYADLDRLFRQWVESLGRPLEGRNVRAEWQLTVLELVRQLGDEVVDDAGPAALVGRVSGGQHRDAGLALHWFRKKLRDVLPRAFTDDDDASPASALTPRRSHERDGHDLTSVVRRARRS